MFKIKKIKTVQFLAKNLSIFIFVFGLYACTEEPANVPVSEYCKVINEKLYSFSRLSDFEKNKFDEFKKSRFSKYKKDFLEAAETFNVEWELLAAVAFQESQWDPKARSATQVKGMMMLTLPTAASVGVTNRLDPIQSIYGGAQYIADLTSSMNYGTSSGDKIAFILASYNLGTTNIKNAIDAIDKNSNEVAWLDLEGYLLNLKSSMDSKDYSRGQQTVDFVERVRDYYYLLLAQNCSDGEI
ncbi:transglycosylase SLT domain-containing protein [Gammaproteobacteria bacterium]|nr:transglycosylase SLT domain-containing protein [Gammaproteobacteria bacterium]